MTTENGFPLTADGRIDLQAVLNPFQGWDRPPDAFVVRALEDADRERYDWCIGCGWESSLMAGRAWAGDSMSDRVWHSLCGTCVDAGPAVISATLSRHAHALTNAVSAFAVPPPADEPPFASTTIERLLVEARTALWALGADLRWAAGRPWRFDVGDDHCWYLRGIEAIHHVDAEADAGALRSGWYVRP